MLFLVPGRKFHNLRGSINWRLFFFCNSETWIGGFRGSKTVKCSVGTGIKVRGLLQFYRRMLRENIADSEPCSLQEICNLVVSMRSN